MQISRQRRLLLKGCSHCRQGDLEGRYSLGTAGPNYTRGFEMHGRQVLFAEGCRGSCSEEAMEHFNLRENCDPQAYGLGIKEVWEVPEENFKAGLIQHCAGWSFEPDTYGGSFLYHQKPNKVLIGMVTGRLQEPLTEPVPGIPVQTPPGRLEASIYIIHL